MIVSALRHFAFVGLLFALAGGWLLTAIVNTLLGVALESSIGHPPTDSYLGSLLLTVVSLALIAAATLIGNRVQLHWLGPSSLSMKALLSSTALFSLVVLILIGPQLGSTVDKIVSHLSYTYNHPWDAAMLLSLPVLRLCFLPLCYFVTGRILLSAPRQETSGRVDLGSGDA